MRRNTETKTDIVRKVAKQKGIKVKKLKAKRFKPSELRGLPKYR